jgi:arylsulfatase A-like enzyme
VASRAGTSIQLTVLSALLSGMVQVAAIVALQNLSGETVSMGPHMLWMIPLANVLLFLVPGILVGVLTRGQPEETAHRLVVFVAAFLGFLNLTLSIPQLHQIASVMLAVGFGVVAARLLVPRWESLTTLARRVTIPLCCGIVLLAVAVFGRGRFEEWRAIRGLPAAPSGVPNVLLLVLDTVRSMNLSAYGYARPTSPSMESLVDRGVVFSNAVATSSWTLPSHGSMFTGHYAHDLTADWEVPLSGQYLTIAEELAGHGYRTGGFSGNLTYVNRYFGLNQGFDHFEDFAISLGEIIVSSKLGRDLVNSRWFRRLTGYHDFVGRRTAEDLTDRFLTWVRTVRGQPFFGFINYFDAHEPYLPPEPFASRFASSATVRQNLKMLHLHHRAERLEKKSLTPAEIQREIDAYDGGIAYADQQVGRLLNELGTLGLIKNTIVILVSDHGEQFGEHQLFEHGNSLYRPVVHVPLVIAGPGVPRQRVEQPVSLRDIPATILDVTQLAQGSFPGGSLRRTWEGTSQDERLFASLTLIGGREVMSVQDGDFYYIERQGKSELFNLREDPGELHNLVEAPELRPMVQSLSRSLDSALQQRSVRR